MLIAVASSDAKTINQHFGHAERFLIYDVVDGKAKLVDEKKVQRYCSYDPHHPLRRHILADIGKALTGCRVIVCAQIGQAPQMEMERLGFDTFIAEGTITTTIVELAKLL